MNKSECISKGLPAYSFDKFLEEVKAWKSLNMDKDSKNIKELLDTLLLQNEEIKKLPTNEEVSKIHSEVVAEEIMRKSKNKSKPKKKWSKEEKKFMVWAVYFYSQINSKKIEEMVRYKLYNISKFKFFH